jgi:hypothetical protein
MAHSEPSTHDGAESGAEGPVLRAQLAIEPHPDSSCAVINAGEDATDVTHRLKGSPPSEAAEFDGDCCECHTEIDFGPDADQDRAYLKSAVSNHCICPIFEEHDCIPRIKGVRSGSMVAVLSIRRREALRDIISDLRAVGGTVSVDWIVEGTDTASTTEIDVSTITDKQQEAMERAREMGYYETPRKAGLGDVAEELGISESAASQRLNAAETKLVTAFLES